ncbi:MULTISPECIES: activator of (R)-2-hydroxyglutaryl-CoA dehydratase [unclassified Halorhodospira]|uniref:activator of (R)-2-hydroxyglutaryl-CoA dehydratase n=1 Tax=unclassified Halorhodospira TaxID=2626748 RepID=UPI001EE9A897|nr:MULTISPECIES: activator of (R)-2-hydroxyglutaryl-CoA dehydratase [unclassified Halorhodospira]MCG5540461.1 activator of (R)-2-hydroxyglutaryl-CoA dehydratase [Halorhodospira sp. M39old]MCG5545043.1 activator of (R)-2-hydroxyglutaryl-CoA dehydratase [Halorhodospira sp. M38]
MEPSPPTHPQDGARRHYRRPAERPFTREERDRVTLLFGSLSVAHDRLLTAAVRGLGYHAEAIPTPERGDLQTGRELCNNGQCNPVYFVAGALINHLERRRAERNLARDEVTDRYVFVTPGSCGPCRFGMYEAQYRQALAKAGYPGFRVIAFDKKGGGDGHPDEGYGDGLSVDLGLYIAVLDALFMADVLNAVFYRARPYATDSSAAERTFKACLSECERALGQGRPHPRVTATARLLAAVTPLSSAEDAARLLTRLRDSTCTAALSRCRRIIEAGFEVDYLRPRPLVKVTGEFWAQTTEGDGNFRMFEFLEGEGAEIQVEPVAGWVDYMRHGLHGQLDEARAAEAAAHVRTGRALLRATTTRLRHWLIEQIGRLLHREYDRMRAALGNCAAPLADQRTLERLGRPYYHPRITGGEGHLEVAKTLYYHRNRLAHMTLSLKPFGCMPSTQSDGAQAAVQADYPDIRFLPIETSGEGEINAYSRAQMALGEARESARNEFQDALTARGTDLDTLRAYIAERPQLRSPLYPIPQTGGAICRAARFVHHLADRMASHPDSPRHAATEHQPGEPRHAQPR